MLNQQPPILIKMYCLVIAYTPLRRVNINGAERLRTHLRPLLLGMVGLEQHDAERQGQQDAHDDEQDEDRVEQEDLLFYGVVVV